MVGLGLQGFENYQDYTATQLGVATAYENTHQ
jgi:hypothetical protein